ncbi:MAG: hypothetical protein ACE5H3_02930, partial [Planctomycetota bacterium]
MRFLEDTVDALDLSAFRARFAGGGPRCQPYDPRMLVKVGTVAIDGSKVKANASRHKATAKDLEEDEQFGEDFQGDEIPEELARRESRLEKIRPARKELEERQRGEDQAAGGRNAAPQDKKARTGGKDRKRPFGKPEDKKQASFTDPDSRIMRTSSKGWEYSYNAQVAVDEQHQRMVSGKLT